ncbi:MAG: TM0106 family RecB-like putative nuclease [Patescibacteria group bacterium]
MKRLTEKTFFYYLKCPNWVRRDVVHGKNLDQLEARLIDDGLLPEVMKKLLLVRGEYVTVEDEDVDDAFRRTLDFMRQGARTIYGGVLVDGHWVGRPDVLERVEGKSDLGGYYYVAVDIKRVSDPRGISDGHRMQGAFYADLLLRVQGVKPTSGYVMSPNGVVMRYDLESFAADYHLTLNDIEHILEGDLPLHVLTSGCKSSPYFSVCVDETESCDDLSLLNRVQVEEIEELNRAGVKTVMELATGDVAALSRKLIEMTDDRLLFLHRQARALKERVHDVVEPVELPSSSVELYFDIESDPVRDLDYLFGVLKVERTKDGSVTDTFHAFLAESEHDEQRAWDEFAAFLHEHRHAPVFHYGWYEISVCAKLIDRYGAPEGAMASWENNFVDLNARLRSAIIFPLSFYSLKDIAQYLGFKWRTQGASGVESIRWYHEWLERGDRALLERIVQYNEDDVRATRLLKEWLEKQRPGA